MRSEFDLTNSKIGEANCEYIQCDVPGQCVGTFVNEASAQTQLECQVIVKSI